MSETVSDIMHVKHRCRVGHKLTCLFFARRNILYIIRISYENDEAKRRGGNTAEKKKIAEE